MENFVAVLAATFPISSPTVRPRAIGGY